MTWPPPSAFRNKVYRYRKNSNNIGGYYENIPFQLTITKLFLYFLDLQSKNLQRIIWDRFKCEKIKLIKISQEMPKLFK